MERCSRPISLTCRSMRPTFKPSLVEGQPMDVTIPIVVVIVVVLAYLYGRKTSPKTTQARTEPSSMIVSYSESPTSSDEPPEESRNQDAWEGWFSDATNPLTVESTLRLKYTDGNEKQTERVVDVEQYDENLHGGIILGHCSLRQGTRTFRIDRINSCVVQGTGEVVEDVRAFLREIYDKSVHSTIDRLRDEEHDLLTVFLFIGKADERLIKKEVDIVAEMCRELTGDQRVTWEIALKMLNQFEIPSLTAYRMAVGTLVSLPEERRVAIIRRAESIVGTQETISGAEQDAIAYLKKILTTGQEEGSASS